jgi:hypothetical protein
VRIVPHPERFASESGNDVASKNFNARRKLLLPLRTDFIIPLLELLVAVSGGLSVEDYAALCPVLWRRCMDSTNPKVISLVRVWLVFSQQMLNYLRCQASFLVMQGAERAPGAIVKTITADIYRHDFSEAIASNDNLTQIITVQILK